MTALRSSRLDDACEHIVDDGSTMSTVNVKTVPLRRGRHASPEQGACVMELASMLAEEPFTDRPEAVCPVIAALLRSYNDMVSKARRQGLYRCASEAIGTRASTAVEQARVDRCLELVSELEHRGSRSLWWRMRSTSPRWLRRSVDVETATEPELERMMAAIACLLAAGGTRGHALMLGLVSELCGIGRDVVDETSTPHEGRASAFELRVTA